MYLESNRDQKQNSYHRPQRPLALQRSIAPVGLLFECWRLWQTHGHDAAAVRAFGAARAGLQTAAVQTPFAARHLHQSRRSGRHGHRAPARRRPGGRPRQSGRRHA